MIKATRDGFGDQLYQEVKKNPQLVVLTADLGSSMRLSKIKKDFPDQFVEVGVAEQNLIGIAAGMAMMGKIPVAASFAAFNPGRNWEQIRVSVCEPNLNVKIVGGHAGLATGPDGATHQALEDVALMSVLPNMSVLAPADYHEAREATSAMLAHPGPCYLRLSREPTPDLPSSDSKFKFGSGRVIRSGEDAVIFTYGLMATLANQAAAELRRDVELLVAVINLPTLKPLDSELILKYASECGAVVVAEEHQRLGGLGQMIAAFLASSEPTPMEFVAVEDKFGQSGTKDELFATYGLTVQSIKEAVLRVLERKIQAYELDE